MRNKDVARGVFQHVDPLQQFVLIGMTGETV
jgi:hypothetical protein